MVLEFRLGPTLLGHRVKVYTNCPEAGDGDAKFCRTSYRVLEWRRDSDNASDDTAVFIDLELSRSGSFRFYFETEGHDLGGEGYFVVDPVLRKVHQCGLCDLSKIVILNLSLMNTDTYFETHFSLQLQAHL